MESYNKEEYLEKLKELFKYVYSYIFFSQTMTVEKAIEQQEDLLKRIFLLIHSNTGDEKVRDLVDDMNYSLNTCQKEKMFFIFKNFCLHCIKEKEENEEEEL